MMRCFLSLICLLVVCGVAGATKPVVDAAALYNHTVAEVERVTGKPAKPQDIMRDNSGELRYYHTRRGEMSVEYVKGRARAFTLHLEPGERDAARALAWLGVSLGKTKPDKQEPLRMVWYRKLGHPTIPVVSLTRSDLNTYNTVYVEDSEE